jgi:hypothetical protein
MRLSSVALALALAPAVVAAQGRGFGRGRGPGNLPHEAGVDVPKQVNVINLLIEHRQELALSDSQFARVIIIKRTVDSTNAPLMRKLDSVQRLFKRAPIFSDPSPARRDSIAEGKAVVHETIAAVREHLDAARDRAYELLSSQQLSKAQDIEAKAQKAIEDEAGRRGRS